MYKIKTDNLNNFMNTHKTSVFMKNIVGDTITNLLNSSPISSTAIDLLVQNDLIEIIDAS